MSESQSTPSIGLSNLKIRQFYDELRRLLRKIMPMAYCAMARTRLHRVLQNQEEMRYFPPFCLLHSMEANCAFYNRHYDPPPDKAYSMRDQSILVDVMNVYHKYSDHPYYMHALQQEKSLDTFAIAMFYEQFDWQYNYYQGDIARAFMLFLRNSAMPKTGQLFESQYGLTVNHWLRLCFLLYAKSHNKPLPAFRKRMLSNSKLACLPKSSVAPFLSLSSRTPDQIGADYRKQRNAIAPFLHVFIRSSFLEYPIIAFDAGNNLIPHLPYMIQHMWRGIYRLSKRWPDFFIELGHSFEKYVDTILGDFPGKKRLLREKEIKNSINGRVCDFAMELDDCIILIECKAIAYTSRLATKSAISGSTSTGKIIDSILQIYNVAECIKNRALPDIADPSKPIVAFTITYDYIIHANMDIFWNSIEQKLREKEAYPDNWPSPLEYRPQIMPVREFEIMLFVLREKQISLFSFIKDKLSVPYSITGDWSAYFDTLLKEMSLDKAPLLPRSKEAFDEFCETELAIEKKEIEY